MTHREQDPRGGQAGRADPIQPPSGVPPLPLMELEARILHEGQGLLVVHKPAGWPTSGRSLGDPDCLQYALIQRSGQMVWAVHQLDADTSGINVFVLEKALVPHWQQRLRSPNGEKTYLAIVDGRATFEQRTVDLPIGPLTEGGWGVSPTGKHALSHLRVRARGEDCSLLEVMIETGRTHQIRIHLAALGHPLIGEDWYGEPGLRRHHRQALHAWKLRFADGEQPAAFDCPLPEDLQRLADQLGLGQVPNEFPG